MDWPVVVLKLCQVMMARSVDWVTRTAFEPCPAMLACPAATCPPVGPASARCDVVSATTAKPAANAMRDVELLYQLRIGSDP